MSSLSEVDGSGEKYDDTTENIVKKLEDFESVAASARRTWGQWISELRSKSTATQTLVGGGVGLGSGYLAKQVSRTAALSVGGGLLFLQLLHHGGYVHVNWNRLRNDASRAAQDCITARPVSTKLLYNLEEFLQDNLVISGSFAVGVAIGFCV